MLGFVVNKMERNEEIQLYVSKLQAFILLLVIGLVFGGFYVNAGTVSHDATEIEVLDYNGVTKTFQQAINDLSLGESGTNGQIVNEACRLCVGPAYYNQEENACDSFVNDGYSHWTESVGWTLGFAQAVSDSVSSPGSSWYYATGNRCKDSCTTAQCDAITSCENGAEGDPYNCCEQIPAGEWNAYDQKCNSMYWPEFSRHWYTQTYYSQTGSNPSIGVDWYWPYVSNLCCKG